ncbi:MAG TPA: hypothetical protein VM925_12785 [Labilithrix sp.]|nr:hypothetical protein [Labilithrix sp.]
MSDLEEERLDQLVSSLLEGERQRKGPSETQITDLWSAVERGLPPGAAPDGPDASPQEAPDVTTGTSRAIDTALRWKIGAVAVGSALIGGAGGAWVHAQVAATPQVVYVERPAQPVAMATPAATPTPVIPPPPPSSNEADAGRPSTTKRSSVPRGRPVPEVPSGSPDALLARERSLLDMGRTALARGDTSAALAAVAALEKEAPHGQLVEEREVLAVQTLVTANRTAEARRRAALFKMNYPSSPLLPVVEDAVSP